MEQWADDAAAVARAVVDDEPVVVIGHSYGGFIAQELMISQPDAVRGRPRDDDAWSARHG